jgi:glycosyltransferase involved in cell wall biosynthesis
MNILLNVQYSLFEASTKKNYTGPLHFSSMLINDIKASPHSFTGLVFKKVAPHDKPYFKSEVVRQGRNKWLILSIWIPTVKIITSRRKMDAETRTVIDKIKKSIAQVRPDVFYLNGFSALAFLVMRATHELDVPTVATHHGIWLKEYMALRRDLIKSPIKYRKELEKDIVRHSRKNIFLSKLSLREFEKHLIKVPKKQLEFIKIPYNPVFVNKSYPKPNPNRKLGIIMVGRWDAVKNHESYLEVAKLAHKRKLPWTFYSVCNIGEYSHYDKIRDDYRKYIKVLPTMSAPELKKMYQKCNVNIIPSHFDVYPGVVTESILQNRPSLISKNVGWVDEFRKHGIGHWITDFSKPAEAIAKIKRVSREQVPRSLYDEVLRVNDPAYVFKKYYELFEEIRHKRQQ